MSTVRLSPGAAVSAAAKPLAITDTLLEFAPSAGWISMMLLPLLFQFAEFHPTGRTIQLHLVALIAAALLLADALCFVRLRRQPVPQPVRVSSAWLVGSALCFLVPALVHLSLMPRIPLVVALLDNSVDYTTLMTLREEASKLLRAPAGLKYAFNWTLLVFAPVFVVLAWSLARYRLAVVGLLVASAYALATLAKLPLLLLVTTCVFAGCFLPSRVRRSGSILIACAVMAVLGLILTLTLSGALSFLKSVPAELRGPEIASMQPDDPRRALTFGDHYRLETDGSQHGTGSLSGFTQYLIYRTWLTPADVSNRWYQYFLYVEKKPLGWGSLLPGGMPAATLAPSRAVGLWAYRARFPHKYLDSISAYASFDADAFARAGVPGVLAATMLLVGARLAAAWLVTPHAAGRVAYGVLLFALTILPSVASVQAMFGAHGLFLLLLALLAIRLRAGWLARRAPLDDRDSQ